LLLAAVKAAGEATTGVGVDIAPELLERGRRLAADRALQDRVSFVEQRSDSWTEPADRVLCIGSSHAFQDIAHTLSALRKLLTPGGRLLFGEGCWERPPNEQAAGGVEGVPPSPALRALAPR